MATTTNYSWTTPDDTDLVKNGASAIRSLGTAIDITTKNLNPSTTLGDIEYRSSSANVNTRLGIGSTGQVLTVSGGVPAWSSPAAGGGITLIQETEASANSAIDFNNISGSYKDLVLNWDGVYHSTTGSNFSIRFNSDSGTNYKIATASIEASLYYGAGQASTNSAYDAAFGNISNSTTLEQTPRGQLTIYNYASNTKFKQYHLEYFFYTTLNSRESWFNVIGIYASTTPITSINIFRNAGSATLSNVANTSIRLLGVA